MKTKFKIFLSVTLFAVILFVAILKAHTNLLTGYDHSRVQSTAEITNNGSGETNDYNFERFETPVYYTVFKFILNFLPLKEPKQTSFYYKQDSILKDQYLNPTLKNQSIA